MAIFATAGAVVSIGQVVAEKSVDFVASDFDAQSWVTIGSVMTIGAFGDQASEVTADLVGEQRTKKLKGTRNAGSMELTCAIDYTDDGQATLRGAQTETYDYAFRVQFNDAPSGGTPSYRYFIAKVMQARDQLQGPNNVAQLMVTLGINSNVVAVDAAP